MQPKHLSPIAFVLSQLKPSPSYGQTGFQTAPGVPAPPEAIWSDDEMVSWWELTVVLMVLVLAVGVPAVQAFQAGGPTRFYLPGWVWGLGILFFWPLGLLWLTLQSFMLQRMMRK